MLLKNCAVKDFFEKYTGKNTACFGVGNYFNGLCDECRDKEININFLCLIDNDELKQGKTYLVNGKKIPVISVEQAAKSNIDVIIIASAYYSQIIRQLESYSEFENIECYIYPLMVISENRTSEIINPPKGEIKIPKIIHYCWFGKNPKPEFDKKCIESWKKYCPDYEIIEWNETNYDIEKNRYTQEAYKHKKWAFLSDYARLDILYNYGGIYFDTDVEVVRNIDELLTYDAFMSIEMAGGVNSGNGMGAKKGMPVVKEMMDMYNNIKILNENGKYRTIPNANYETNILKKYGFKKNNKFQIIDDVAIYPFEYFASKVVGLEYIVDFKDKYSIHHYNQSWVDDKEISDSFKDRILKLLNE